MAESTRITPAINGLRVSFRVGYKDDQRRTWISWLGRINEIESQHVARRISKFARALKALEEDAGGSEGSRPAAEELVRHYFSVERLR